MILGFLRANGRKLTTHTVNSFTELLYIVVGFQVLGYLGIMGKMGVADIVGADDTWQLTRGLEHKSVVKHLYLYLRSFDAIIAVANRVYRHLLYHELRIFPVGLEESVLTEIGMFLHLRFEVVDGFLYLVEDAPLEGDILDDVHFPADFLFRTIVLDKTDTGTREKVLGTLTEEQDAGSADLWYIALVSQESFVLLQVFHWRLAITNALHICFYGVNVDILDSGIVGRDVLINQETHQASTFKF